VGAGCLRVDVHLSGAATMPGGEQNTAATALMLDVLERVHDVGNAAQAGKAAETKSPSVCGVADFVGNVGHGALAASRAIGWSRSSVERSNRGGVLVDSSTRLLRRHAWVLVDSLLRLDVCTLGLLRVRRARLRELLLRLLIHLVLVVLRVRVLVVDWGLRLRSSDVRRQRVLVHGDTLFLHCERIGFRYCLKTSG
jgi:hypothetical protein